MSRRGVSDQAPKAQISIIGAKVKGTKVGTMVAITVRVIMSEMETHGIRGNYCNRNDRTGPNVPPQNREVLLGMVEIVWRELRICCTK